LKNKDIEDSGSFHEEHMFSDENSDSSGGDILLNPEDIKKMAPYDQRKDPNAAQNYSGGTKKLNIMYEELEDSGSEGSGPLLNEEANRLASIIEEEEEATEYQRSRSRKSGSLSPVPFNMKTGVSEAKRNEELNENILSNIEPVVEWPVPPIEIKEVKPESKRAQKPSSVSARLRGTPRLQKEEKKKKEKCDKKSPKPSELKTMKQQPIEKLSDKPIENKQLKNMALPEKLKESEKDKVQKIQTPAEESVKLDQPHEDPQTNSVQKQPLPKERSMRSPNNARIGRRDLSERNFSISWQGPKYLKVIFSILLELGNEKHIDFTDFLRFYLVMNEVGNNKKLSGAITFKAIFEKYRRTIGKPEGNVPHFLWAFMNPDRRKYLKKKTLRGIIKSWNDNKGKGRKSLLDSLEESIRSDEGDISNSSPSSVNIRLTFNYPGTKRALILFSKTLFQIDNRTVTSREVNTFITNALKQSESLPSIAFKDPIHGIEPIHHSEEEEIVYSQPQKIMTLPNQVELEAIIQSEKADENIKKLRKDRSNKTLNADNIKNTFISPAQNIFTSNDSQQPWTVNQSIQKLKIDYEDGRN
jgi:hypothetical protein